MTPHERLDHALAELLLLGRHPLGATAPDRWTSEHPAALEQAAQDCAGCPLLEPCRVAGDTEDAHVWGGVIRTPDRRRKRAAA